MTNFISKDSINRLLKDVKNIIQNPLIENGIYYIHDDSDLLKGYALIVGPEDTPYFGGYYFFELSFPFDYPHTPPKVKYCTNGNDIRFNPNLYKCGKVCISLLNTWRGDQWTSCQTISTVLLTLCTLLCKDPLLNEPGISKGNADMKSYTNIIDYSNLNIAVCDIINKKEGVYHSFFEIFEPFVNENFLKNYDKLIKFAENKNNEFINKPIIFTNAYNMKVILDYEKIIEKLKNCKLKINLIN
jgi:ubiquitin-protein ligase